jgi:NitT/TauT family transport system permease protein
MNRFALLLFPGIIFLALWQLCSVNSTAQFLFSNPLEIAIFLWNKTLSGELPFAAVITGIEALVGFIIGGLSGIVAGFLLWYSPILSRISRPYLLAVGAVPVFAFAPLIIVWFGIGFWMKVWVAALGTFLTALDQSFRGASNLNAEEEQFLKVLGATRSQLLYFVAIPRSVSWVMSSLRLNVGTALLGAFVGEFISADEGLGYVMVKAGSLFDVATVFAAATYLIALSFIFHAVLAKIECYSPVLIARFSVRPEVFRLRR